MSKQFARLQDGVVAEFISFDPEGLYHPDTVWRPVPESLNEYADYNYVDGGEAITPPYSNYLATQIKALIASHRWRIQNAGVLVNGVPVRTTDYDYAMLKGAIDALESGDIPDTDWKSASGWVTVTSDDLPMLIAFRKATAIHIRDCFRRERALSEQLDAIVTAAEPDVFDQLLAVAGEISHGWPPTLADNKADQPEPA